MEMSENQNTKKRLLQFIMFKNISVHKFEIEVGLSNGYVKNMRNSIQPDKVRNIVLKFPDLNPGWLLTGEGEMLRGQVQNVNGHHNTATMNGDITQNYAPGSDINVMLVNEISEHRRIISKSQQQIDKSQEQIDELIGIIRELAGKLKVES